MGPPQKKRKQEEENNDQGRNKQDEGTNTPITRECRLLQLPRELRDNVYTFLWTSTRVTFGQRCRGRIGTGRIERKNMKPAPNSLALLRVCRQTFEENKSLWLGRVLFNFEGVRSLLDKLSLLPSTKLSQIRYVCTRGYALKPSYGEYNFYCRLVWALKLLPGLRLDTLTVLGSSEGFRDYDTLNGLIEHGTGWKELHYITRDSTMLGFNKKETITGDPYRYRRRPQPDAWKKMSLARDGADSQANVTIYQAAKEKRVGAPFDENSSRPLEQTVTSPGALKTFRVQADIHLMSEGERQKELLVVVRRGQGADISEPEEGPVHCDDIRLWGRGRKWPEIKNGLRPNFSDSDSEDGIVEEPEEKEEEVFETDVYHGVNDYVWDDTTPW